MTNLMNAGIPKRTSLGPAGITGAPGNYLKPNQDIPSAGGAWASQTFTASGSFTVPPGLPVNKRGKVELFITACAGGGAGGGGGEVNQNATLTIGGSGQGGDWTYRFKVQAYPGETIPVTIGAGGAPGGSNAGSGATPGAGAAGGSTTFGAYVTLSGGAGGLVGSNGTEFTQPYNPANSGAIISGAIANDNAIHEGARGASGFSQPNFLQQINASGNSVLILGPYTAVRDGGGGGLFGMGGTWPAGAAGANTGAGGSAPGATGLSFGGVGGSGQLIVEWRIPA